MHFLAGMLVAPTLWIIWVIILTLLFLIYQELRGHTRQQRIICDAAIRFLEMTKLQRAPGPALPDHKAIWPWWDDATED
jgi:hypothetical protein